MTDVLIKRELLEELRDAANESMNATTRQHQIDYFAGLIAKADTILSAPSPAGVGGLEVVAWVTTGFSGKSRTRRAFTVNADDAARQHTNWTPHYRQVTTDQLCRLSDATAIIDGLRGEVEEWRLRSQYSADTAHDVASERDQQARRIGELERALLEVAASLAWNAHGECRAIHDGPIMPSQMALDAAKAALAAGKDSAP